MQCECEPVSTRLCIAISELPQVFSLAFGEYGTRRLSTFTSRWASISTRLIKAVHIEFTLSPLDGIALHPIMEQTQRQNRHKDGARENVLGKSSGWQKHPIPGLACYTRQYKRVTDHPNFHASKWPVGPDQCLLSHQHWSHEVSCQNLGTQTPGPLPCNYRGWNQQSMQSFTTVLRPCSNFCVLRTGSRVMIFAIEISPMHTSGENKASRLEDEDKHC